MKAGEREVVIAQSSGTMTSLRDELSQRVADILEIAKWKMVAVAALTVAGFGWADVKPGSDTGILILYSVGFLCAYTDGLYYRRAMVIHAIAGFFRQYKGHEVEMVTIRDYEKYVGLLRKGGQMFLSDRWPQFTATMAISIGIPLLGHLHYGTAWDWRVAIPCVALALNISAFVLYGRARLNLMRSH